MNNPPEIPRLDQAPPDAQPRTVRFRVTTAPASRRFLGLGGFLGRRGFLGVLGAGAMTLGLTVLGWIPLARPASAEAGTEWPDCGRYDYGPSHGPDRPMCVGAPYSPNYCGADRWFMTGCYSTSQGQVCYEAAAICRAGPDTTEGRNAWRWVRDNIVYRCADGHALYEGAPNPEVLICLAKLSSEPSIPPSSSPPTSPPPTSPPTSPPPSSPFLPSAPAPPELPSPLPSLPSLPALPPIR